uniref:Toll-like receptor 13 n=1 Tax=Petromyzon marinus TaxID=7757 RepID=A0AAJ7X0R1_PETMA|nr:toll-like receptor 13 [Petromyzon marinus]
MARLASWRSLPAALLLASLGLVAPPATLGFFLRKCIQDARFETSVACVDARITDARDAIADLHGSPRSLNLSRNEIAQLTSGGFKNLSRLVNLRLDRNRIRSIQPGAFEGLKSLLSLNLTGNDIVYLEADAFKGAEGLLELLLAGNTLKVAPEPFQLLRHLVNVSLMENSLFDFSRVVEAVSGLPSLRSLDLDGNNFTVLSVSRASIRLPRRVRSLHIAGCGVRKIALPRDFFANVAFLDMSGNNLTDSSGLAALNLSRVEEVSLGANNLSSGALKQLRTLSPTTLHMTSAGLSGTRSLRSLCNSTLGRRVSTLTLLSNDIRAFTDAFTWCRELASLDLSSNNLKSMGKYELVNGSSSLRDLTVQHNHLTSLESCWNSNANTLRCANLSQLETLSLAYNRITHLDGHALIHAPNLLSVALNFNTIANINLTAFAGLIRLVYLRLDNNLITDIRKQLFHGLENLETLNMRNNKVTTIFPHTFTFLRHLQILDLGGNRISSLKQNAMSGLLRLRNLYIDGNFLRIINSHMFNGLHSLHNLDLVRNSISYKYRSQSNAPFVNLTNLTTLKLSAQQPYGLQSIPVDLFKGLRSLKYLYLAGNKISFHNTLPFDELVSLKYLGMQDVCSGLQNMNANMFQKLTQLGTLDLGNIGINFLHKKQFQNQSNMRVLYLSANGIRAMIEDVIAPMKELRYLDVTSNPLQCTCDNAWFKNWSRSSDVQVVGLYGVSCSGDNGAAGNSSRLFVDFDASVCYEKWGRVMFVLTLPFFSLLTACPLVFVKARWHIRYGYYMFRAWFREYRRRDEDARAYDYDAFISYNSRDEDWVMGELVPRLEQEGPPFCKLCLHHRDFALGKYIVDNIVDAIYRSRKTVCVISRSYLESEWCSWEIQMAAYRLFDEHKDVVIMVFLEDIPDYKLSAYHRMRKIIGDKTYISWPEDAAGKDLFWAKLRAAIRGPVAMENRLV